MLRPTMSSGTAGTSRRTPAGLPVLPSACDGDVTHGSSIAAAAAAATVAPLHARKMRGVRFADNQDHHIKQPQQQGQQQEQHQRAEVLRPSPFSLAAAASGVDDDDDGINAPAYPPLSLQAGQTAVTAEGHVGAVEAVVPVPYTPLTLPTNREV